MSEASQEGAPSKAHDVAPALSELKTPCALVDAEIVERNTSRMAETASRLGVALRPHLKTHKCIEVGRLQVRGHFGGVTVSTLAEARFFADHGFRDITWAFPLPPGQLDEVFGLADRVDQFQVLLDHEVTRARVEEETARRGRPLSVLLKVDCGYHRAGVDPRDPESLALAQRIVATPGIDFRGVLTHAGHSYDARTPDEIRIVSRQERDEVVAFARRLRQAGIEVPTVSLGSTPTLCVPAEHLEGVTEVRPGNYAFFDLFQVAVGACRREDVAFSVLATVVGHYPEQRKLLINAGALALSKDLGASHVFPDGGFGRVVSVDGGTEYPDWKITSLSQEHGQVIVPKADALSAFPVGSPLRILPNHSCLTAALFDVYHVVRGNEIIDAWRPIRCW